mgnify:CR=1 FL=1
MRKETFNYMMSFFKNSYNVLLSDERITAYWEVLRKYPDRHSKRAVFLCTEKYEFFPKISQIVEMIKYCEEDDANSYRTNTRKIAGPITAKIGLRWLRQTRALLSCEKRKEIVFGRLYTEEELEDILKHRNGHIREWTEGKYIEKKEG